MNGTLLREYIKDAGFTVTSFARKIGISREALYSKLSGKREFKLSEINMVTQLLSLSDKERDAIFFAKSD